MLLIQLDPQLDPQLHLGYSMLSDLEPKNKREDLHDFGKELEMVKGGIEDSKAPLYGRGFIEVRTRRLSKEES